MLTSCLVEIASNTGADVTKPAPDDAPKHTNGDNHASNSDQAGHAPEESKSTDAPGPVDAARTAEKPPSGGPVLATSVDSQEPASEAKDDAPNTGDKREHESTAAPTETEKPSAESSGPSSTAPAAKKQKTNDKTATENGTQANGEKKTKSRTNKVKETVKKVVPTDGIGSRTRSRTKAVS